MTQKLLLATISLAALHSLQANQPTHTPIMHGPMHHQMPTQSPSPCPPCPCGGMGGWVLIPAGPGGTPCNQPGGGSHTPIEPQSIPEPTPEISEPVPPHPVVHHQAHPAVPPHKAPTHHEVPPQRSLHPLPTAEQEQLENELKPIKAHIYLRANPHSPDPTKKEGEWGKALNGKVYFRHLGNWVYDPSVNPSSDIVVTGVKEKVGFFNKLFPPSEPRQPVKPAQGQPVPPPAQPPQQPSKPGEAGNGAEKPVEPAVMPVPPTPGQIPPPPPPGSAPNLGKPSPRKSWPKVNAPDALGTTESRVQSVYTNPTEGNQRQFGLGAPNRSQIGITGQPAPRVDVAAPTAPSVTNNP